MNQPLTTLLKRLWLHISPRRRSQFALLLGFTLLSSIAEVVSLGAVLPFVGIITQPEQVLASPWLSGLVQALDIKSGSELVLPLSIGFAVTALIAGGLRLLLLRVSIRLSNGTGADLSINVYLRTLHQDYGVHIARSSSEIISGITQKVGAATMVLISLTAVVTSTVLFVTIMVTLLAIDPVVAVLATASFGATYGIIAWFARRTLVSNSECIAKEQVQVVKALQEGLGAIRDVLLDGSQQVYCDIYRKAILQLQRANGENSFINQAPRYGMEALGMVLIATFVVVLNHRPDGIVVALPILGVMALAAQRLLPLMQQLYGNWSVVAGSKAALDDVLTLLDQSLPIWVDQPEPQPLVFKESIVIDNVSFRYNNNTPWVLKGINLSIPKGARIGVIGTTGSGKSTVMDLLMGLLQPTQGQIMIDGKSVSLNDQRAWQRTVAHVPQNIFLADTTIAENIAFGIPPDQIDLECVRKAAQQARISDYIENRAELYNAIVGERGIRLSGGQRQRIGIARALYKQCSVLVFDEATSALDTETEQAVMQTIEDLSKDLTLFMVAHRLTTLAKCDVIIKLDDGKITAHSTYNELIKKQEGL
jgi:ATP-binding cassette, subfamily B, bacterial PglK